MCEIGEELKFQTDTIHHSIALFDIYFSGSSNREIELKMRALLNKQDSIDVKWEHIVQVICVVCMLISAKFLEKTYPGVNKLNSVLSPSNIFSYDDFISTEKHILESMNWDLHITTPYEILQHFISQGILFSTD